ncbi:uncharacterized protein MONOS_16181 [Monocercomonoides exilis]|uniref:uncharacterized protein n=1 Tax=Monocercomonoides exilis TaxID=2049356 RepID=UPI00355A23F5|nr:hypothetical protein MONOS_16181 [Monocercomonoides exilis]|eukprot:MONOS_16181.1-p1 / transcript=MONOS_16181.1 / gene=MONOS_16181 / organism=Monocercomonoides_exilis_PA203 / gene_product=unspecified product / transcript_product=unspecified product / location=Mono_scaffold01549:2289-2734(-) / protein_length=120 / sequence_SO=supercontig / SO=protein_coding / is_pseudo=false
MEELAGGKGEKGMAGKEEKEGGKFTSVEAIMLERKGEGAIRRLSLHEWRLVEPGENILRQNREKHEAALELVKRSGTDGSLVGMLLSALVQDKEVAVTERKSKAESECVEGLNGEERDE